MLLQSQDVAPILLRVFFDTVVEDASYDIIQSVTVIMLDRILRCEVPGASVLLGALGVLNWATVCTT